MDYLVKIRSVQTPLNGQFSIGANTALINHLVLASLGYLIYTGILTVTEHLPMTNIKREKQTDAG